MSYFLDKLALAVSTLASPFVTIFVFALLVLFYYSSNPNDTLFFGIALFIFLVFIPFAYIYQQVRAGKISDIHITLRKQRTKPFLVAIISTLTLVGLFHSFHAPNELIQTVYVMLLNSAIFLFITQYWKISVHLAALSGSVTITTLLIDPDYALLFLTVPLVAWARMRRHKHNIWQVTAASLLAPFVTLLALHLTRLRQLF